MLVQLSPCLRAVPVITMGYNIVSISGTYFAMGLGIVITITPVKSGVNGKPSEKLVGSKKDDQQNNQFYFATG